MDLFCLLIQVAAVSGDARRALEICRRAAELADYRSKKMDSISNNASTGEIVSFCSPTAEDVTIEPS